MAYSPQSILMAHIRKMRESIRPVMEEISEKICSCMLTKEGFTNPDKFTVAVI